MVDVVVFERFAAGMTLGCLAGIQVLNELRAQKYNTKTDIQGCSYTVHSHRPLSIQATENRAHNQPSMQSPSWNTCKTRTEPVLRILANNRRNLIISWRSWDEADHKLIILFEVQ